MFELSMAVRLAIDMAPSLALKLVQGAQPTGQVHPDLVRKPTEFVAGAWTALSAASWLSTP